MSGGTALTLVWLGASSAAGGLTNDALRAWEDARGIVLERPVDGGGAGSETPVNDEALQGVAERCDELLMQARDLMTEGDETGAALHLATVEQLLRENAPLPQAAWLMAERWRLGAQIEGRRGHAERARDLEQEADALEGPRAAPFGKGARASDPAPKVSYAFLVRGARRHQAYLDGIPMPDQGEAAGGEHHLAIARGGRARWSGWITLTAAAKIDLWIPDAPPCSREDLEDVRLDGERAVVPPGVGCPNWIVATEGARPGAVRVARCELGNCEPLREWAARPPDLAAGGEVHPNGLPPWAVWTLAGVGTLTAATVVLWRLGAFDQPSPRSVVTYDGGHL